MSIALVLLSLIGSLLEAAHSAISSAEEFGFRCSLSIELIFAQRCIVSIQINRR